MFAAILRARAARGFAEAAVLATRGQSQQRHRPAAHPAALCAPTHRARGDRDGHESSGRDRLSHQARAARRWRSSTTPSARISKASAASRRWRARRVRSTRGWARTAIAVINADDALCRPTGRARQRARVTFIDIRSRPSRADVTRRVSHAEARWRLSHSEPPRSRIRCAPAGCPVCTTSRNALGGRQRLSGGGRQRSTMSCGSGATSPAPTDGCSDATRPERRRGTG